ncbi:MAG: DUF4440 domain-containing protein [Terracidiphilus sp.]
MIVKFRVLKLSVLCFAWAATAVSQSSLERQVLDTDSAWANAENRHDIAALDRILDDQCVITSASGRTESKQEFLKQFSGEVKSAMTQDLVDRKVHIDGDTAILTETDNYTYAESGHTSAGSLRLTTTYLDRGDLWVAIAEQMNAPRSKPDLSAAEATLRKLDAEWAQTKSVDAWLGFYADDAIVLPPNDKVAHGKEAARKSVAELLGLPGLQLTWNANRVEVAASGDFAYITGVYTMSFNDDASKRISDAGKTPRGLESSARQKMEVRRRYLELRPAGIGTIGKPAGPGTISRHGNPNPWPAFG